MIGNRRLHVSGRREPVPEPSRVLHDAPSCGMSVIGCEEGTDGAQRSAAIRVTPGQPGHVTATWDPAVRTTEFHSPLYYSIISGVDPVGVVLAASFVSGGLWSSKNLRKDP